MLGVFRAQRLSHHYFPCPSTPPSHARTPPPLPPPPTPCGHHLEAFGVVKDADAPGQGVDDLVAGEAGPAEGVEVGGDLLALRVPFPPHPGHVGAAPPFTCTRPYVAHICVCPLCTHLGWGGKEEWGAATEI